VKVNSQQDKTALVLFKTTHWMAQEDIPLSKFGSLSGFMTEVGVPDLELLKQKAVSYSSRYTATEILSSMTATLDVNLKKKLGESPFVTVLTDESTDISNHKRLVVYVQIVNPDTFAPCTHFVANKECRDATGVGIAKAIEDVMSELDVPLTKVMSMGSDGAAVMTGRNKGCTGILLRANPHMVNVHCAAHSLALCTSQAAEAIPDLKEHQQILTDLFYYFRGSPKRAARIQDIQILLEDPVLTYKELHSVRWLSYYNALQSVHRTIDSLLSYFTDVTQDVSKDPKANGLKKKIGTVKFISITALMMDAMAPVTILSQFLQTENVDVALVKVKLDVAIHDLKKIKEMKSSNLTALASNIQDNKYKGEHQITRGTFNLEQLCVKFIDNMITNMHSRFPNTSLLTAFGVLSLRPIARMSDEELNVFGEEELERLIAHYGCEQTHTWKEDREDRQTTSKPLIDAAKTREEWALVKKVVKAQQYTKESMWKLWSEVTKYHKDEFPNLIILAQLATTLAVHTAGCERGFSKQNLILTPHRNRLTLEHQEQLLKVNLGPTRAVFPFEEALDHWKHVKDRRLYTMKYTK